MKITTSDEFLTVGKKLSDISGDTFTKALNDALNSFLNWPFKAISGCIIDSQNQKSDTFGTIIYTSSISNNNLNEEPIEVTADTAACYIDVSDNLDLEKFRAAYSRIAFAKKLKKSPIPHIKDMSVTTSSLGIIFANNSTISLEELAEEIERLNEQEPGAYWPNMVVALTQGMISYAVQFPGENSLSDLLPPDEGALNSIPPAMYIVMVLCPIGEQTFNRMCALLIAQLNHFSPGVNLPYWKEVIKNCPKFFFIKTGYQYNLHSGLCPVPPHLYNVRYLPQIPLRIEDKQGKLWSTLQFVPWQDGGVILLRGKLPLESLLILLDLNASQIGSIIKLKEDLQISYVLPITLDHINKMLLKFQQQSNMVVRSGSDNIVKQRISDEGISSPFVARLYFGILTLKDSIFHDTLKRDEFSKVYFPIVDTLSEIRATNENIIKLLEEHFRKVSQGEIAHLEDKSIRITESIDRELKKQIESFLNSATRVFKGRMQNVTTLLNTNIAFLY